MEKTPRPRTRQYFILVLVYGFFIFPRTPQLALATASESISSEQKILHDVFKNYDKDAHPGGGMPVKVLFGAKLARLVKVEEINNIIKAQWWMKQSWYNPDVRWNKSEYGNVSIVYVEPTRIWVPDILLYNNGDEKVEAAGGPEKFRTKISMTDQGTHTWFAPTIFSSICKMDVRFFPFDDQSCHLQFGSWAYDSSKIDIEIDYNETGINHNIFQENNEWKIKKVKAEKRMKYYDCCGYPYADILINVHMSRRSYHYMINLVFPCAVIACMVFFTFILPAESGERISLCITVLMAMTIFQELTSEKLPVSPDGFILIEMYYTSAITYIGLAIAATCIVLNFYYTKTKMPAWLKTLLLGRLASCIGIKKRNNQKERRPEMKEVTMNPNANNDTEVESQLAVTLKSITHRRRQSHEAQDGGTDSRLDNVKHTNGLANGTLRRNRSSTRTDPPSTVQVSNKDITEEDWEEDWKTASRVLDRIILVTGMVVALVTSVTIFLHAPRVQDMFMGNDGL